MRAARGFIDAVDEGDAEIDEEEEDEEEEEDDEDEEESEAAALADPAADIPKLSPPRTVAPG
jgi:hypothetical protein